jgi:hypothetical protein
VDCDDVLAEEDGDEDDEPRLDVREEVLEPLLVAVVEDEDDDPSPELLALEVVDLVDEEVVIPVEEVVIPVEEDVVRLADEDEPMPELEVVLEPIPVEEELLLPLPEDDVLLVVVEDPDDE